MIKKKTKSSTQKVPCLVNFMRASLRERKRVGRLGNMAFLNGGETRMDRHKGGRYPIEIRVCRGWRYNLDCEWRCEKLRWRKKKKVMRHGRNRGERVPPSSEAKSAVAFPVHNPTSTVTKPRCLNMTTAYSIQFICLHPASVLRWSTGTFGIQLSMSWQ